MPVLYIDIQPVYKWFNKTDKILWTLGIGHLINCVVTILCLAKTVCQLTSLVVQTDLQSMCLYGLISLLVYIVIQLYLIEFSSYCTYHSHFSCYKSSPMERLRAAIQGSSILYCMMTPGLAADKPRDHDQVQVHHIRNLVLFTSYVLTDAQDYWLSSYLISYAWPSSYKTTI